MPSSPPSPFPTDFFFAPGGEVAATVVARGPGVEVAAVDARILALAGTNGFGGYAQFPLCSARTAVPPPEGLGIDLALECSGGTGLPQRFAALAPFGRQLAYGSESGEPAAPDAATVDAWLGAPAVNQRIAGFDLGDRFQLRPQRFGAALAALVEGILSEDPKGPAIITMDLSEAGAAHRMLEGRKARGKLVVRAWS